MTAGASSDELFSQAIGYYCVDAGQQVSTAGSASTYFLRRFRRNDLWPIDSNIAGYSEADLFTMMEAMFDLIAKPASRYYHSWDQCGWHASGPFDAETARGEYREAINEVLATYGPGYELSELGEIRELGPDDQRPLLAQVLPSVDPERFDSRVEAAKSLFLRYGATVDDRRNSVRQLADALEYARPRLNEILTRKDEADLFELANRFGIRHNDDKQKTDYDAELWLEWMFFHYLNTTTFVSKVLTQRSGPPESGENANHS
jgi:hypothetical protein